LIGGVCNIMIVMREGEVVEHLQRLLHSLGYRIGEVSHSGGKALRSAAVKKFDIVIIGGSLPDTTGLNAALDILELQDTGILLITTENEKSYIESKFAGYDITCLVKPVSRTLLQHSLEMVWKYRCKLGSLQKSNARLQETLDRRVLVAKAKAVLMEKQLMSEPDAYRAIQKTSMDTGIPVVEIARTIIDSEGREFYRY